MISERTGRCLCGGVRFTARETGDTLGACHCGMCRRWTGSVSISLAVPAAALSIEGADLIRAYSSSDWAERTHCGNCGSPLWYQQQGTEMPADYYVTAGLFDDLTGLTVDHEIYVDCRLEALSLAGPTKQMTEAEVLASSGVSASPEE